MPVAVLIVAIPIIASQLVQWLLPGMGRWIFDAAVLAQPGPGQAPYAQPLGPYFPYIGHVLVHFGGLHIGMNLAILVSMGRPVAGAFGPSPSGIAGFVLLFILCSIAGALAQVALSGGEAMMMGGASTGVSGLMAAGGWAMGGYRGMLRYALPWVAINLALGLAGMAWPIPIGWAAHIGGVVAGAILFPLMLPLFQRR